jgi:hypothetical protein
VLSTDFKSSAARLAPAMFARSSKENFFRSMRQSYNLDGLVDYGTDLVPETTMVVLCQEDAKASCCTRDEGRPFGVAL